MHWHFLLHMFVALLLGTAIGVERQWKQHPAGLRTNALVALGAALFVSLSRLMDDSGSPTRIASYIVSGLGFLGGGVILRDGMNVKGLNTAATLWCTGAVGTLAGAGFPLEAIFGTAGILSVNLGLRSLSRWIDLRNKSTTDIETYYRLRVTCGDDEGPRIRGIVMRHIGGHPKMNVQGISTEESEEGVKLIVADVFAMERNDRVLEDAIARLSIEPGVTGVSWQRTSG